MSTHSTIPTKLCSRCKKRLPMTTDYFSKRKDTGGYVSHCRECRKLPPLHKTADDRFWDNVVIGGVDDCWLWQGNKDKDGYGKVTRFKKNRRAHHVSYEIENGVLLPKGVLLMHSCDTPGCVNPKHLSIGTQLHNRRDAVRKNRQAKGEDVGNSRFSIQDVRKIRSLYLKRNVKPSKIAQIFSTSPSVIWSIGTGRSWKHALTEEEKVLIAAR